MSLRLSVITKRRDNQTAIGFTYRRPVTQLWSDGTRPFLSSILRLKLLQDIRLQFKKRRSYSTNYHCYWRKGRCINVLFHSTATAHSQSPTCNKVSRLSLTAVPSNVSYQSNFVRLRNIFPGTSFVFTPLSPNPSPIIWSWYNRPVVAAVPSDSVPPH
jgi:hypothetical protein